MRIAPEKSLPPLVEHCLELFAPLGAVRPNEYFFALITDDTLFLKVDDQTEPTFRDAGSFPFTYIYKDGRSVTMAYWSAPEEAMESPPMMQDWVRLALGAALRAKLTAKKKPAAR